MKSTDSEGVENGSDNGEQENGSQVIEKETIGHEVPGIEDDRWEHAEEEDRCR